MSRRLASARVAAALAALGAFAACSGSDETTVGAPAASPDAGTTSAPTASGTDASSSTPTTTTDAATAASDAPAGDGGGGNCVAKSYGGNDKKIGAYCDDQVGCPFQIDPFLVCTAGHDPTGTHLFCTTPCSKDSECGTNAYCMHDSSGSGCVPAQCGGAPGH